MARFQLNISDPDKSRPLTVKKEVEADAEISHLIGKRIGEEIEGDALGLEGYKLLITGGSDKDGFPMAPSVPGGVKKKVLSAGGVGYRSKRKGIKRRKRVRGNTVTEDCYQINMKIVEKGSKPLEELL